MKFNEKIALQAVNYLRDQGYSIVMWTPEEVGDANSSTLEDLAIMRGNDYLCTENGEKIEKAISNGADHAMCALAASKE